MSARPVYVITVQALPGIHEIHALRHALKRLLRGFGLRCLSIEEQKA